MSIDLSQLPFADGIPAPVRRALASARPMFEAAEVERAIDQLAVRLTVDWQDRNPVMLGVLPRGIVLLGMLMRRMIFPLQAGCIAEQGGGATIDVRELDITGRELLFLHGQGDSARSKALSDWAMAGGAAGAQHVALVSRAHVVDGFVDTALICSAADIVGCGMGYAGYGANLPGIYALESLT